MLAYPSKYASVYGFCSSVPDFVVPLPSVPTSRSATLRLLMVQGVTPAHKGLAPSRIIPYLRYGKDAHAGHTQNIKKIGQVSARPKVLGVFTGSPNLLIWLLENKVKQNTKDLACG